MTNPREGYIGYHYDPPEAPFGAIGVDWSAVPIVFEVCEHGGVARDSGIIAYADSHVVYEAGERPPSD
ncbi:MAG: hypothetical protein AAF333_08665 [Planctomycetota bacterium]